RAHSQLCAVSPRCPCLSLFFSFKQKTAYELFQLFDHNIAYEIRLNRAMEEEMLSAFHYYGVTDLSIDNTEVDHKSDFRYLVSEERVERIIEHARFYGSDNGITRGLIFCSRRNEAMELSKLFNARGFKTIAL